MIRCIIVEDEAHCISTLRRLISKHQEQFPCRVIAEAASCTEAIEAINTLKPDLVFMDIELRDGSSLTLFPHLLHLDFKLIFTTAFEQFALQAIRLSALDYLIKPLDDEDFIFAMERLHTQLAVSRTDRQLSHAAAAYEDRQQHHIAIRQNDDIYFLKIRDILALRAKGAYTEIVSRDNPVHLSSKNLRHFEEIVGVYPSFVRIHHAAIVNLDYLKKLHYPKNSHYASVILTDGSSHEVSLRKLAQLKGMLNL
jgi:two-component system LytT family response regulator